MRVTKMRVTKMRVTQMRTTQMRAAERGGVDTSHRKRPGYALIVALGALIVLGASIAGLFQAALQSYRSGSAALDGTRALAASEYGLYAVLDPARWDARWTALRGGLVGTFVFTPEPGVIDSVRIVKLTAEQFVVLSDARVGSVRALAARRRTGLLVVLDTRIDSASGVRVPRSVPIIARERSWIQLP